MSIPKRQQLKNKADERKALELELATRLAKTSSASLVKQTLIELIGHLSRNQMETFSEFLLGNRKFYGNKFPKTSSLAEDAVFISYDPFENEVMFEYTMTVTRFFKSKEDAEKAIEKMDVTAGLSAKVLDFTIDVDIKKRTKAFCHPDVWIKFSQEK